MIPLAEKLVILRYVALRYVHASGGRYEADELIDEAWLNENVRTCESRARLFIAARWAMISYMQFEQKAKRKNQPHFISTESIDEPEFRAQYKCEYLDELEYFCRSLTREQKAVVKMRLSGLTWKEIGKCIDDLSGEMARQIFRRTMALIRIKYEICYRIAG